MTEEEFFSLIEAKGHKLIRLENGEVDTDVLDVEGHNGPGCSVCDDRWCQWCQDEVEPCIGEEGVKRQNEEFHRERIARAVKLLEENGYTVTVGLQQTMSPV